jgi:hypothetical protein
MQDFSRSEIWDFPPKVKVIINILKGSSKILFKWFSALSVNGD